MKRATILLLPLLVAGGCSSQQSPDVTGQPVPVRDEGGKPSAERMRQMLNDPKANLKPEQKAQIQGELAQSGG